MRKKIICDAIILLRKEIGDWRGRADTFWGSAINYGTQGKQNQGASDLLGTIGNLDFCCEAEGEAEALKNRVTLLEVALMKPKNNCLDLRTKSRPEFLAGPKLTFHRSLLFSTSHSLKRRQNSHSVFRREISKFFLSSDFIFAILFEHQFNNLVEFSEVIFVK
jgi:hypothetical protein